MEMSQEITEIAGALALAQAEIESAAKDRVNPHFRSAYATLASVWDACRAPLTKHGLSVTQGAKAEGAVVTVTSMLIHKSGQWFRDQISMRATNDTPQAIGSAITYGRRYALAALVGVAPDDDDGNAGSGAGRQEQGSREPAESRQEARPAEDCRAGTTIEYDSPVRTKIKDVQSKSGPKKDGGTYTRYGIETVMHGFFTTFNPAFADIALEAQRAGREVVIAFHANGRWKDMDDIKLAGVVEEAALPL